MPIAKPTPIRKRGGATLKKEPLPHPIQVALKEKGKSQKWLASKIGKSEQTIGNICARRSRLYPSSMIAINIMKALEIDENYLYGIYPRQ
jgi:DNA-binding XRE family transcriptional regulator